MWVSFINGQQWQERNFLASGNVVRTLVLLYLFEKCILLHFEIYTHFIEHEFNINI